MRENGELEDATECQKGTTALFDIDQLYLIVIIFIIIQNCVFENN